MFSALLDQLETHYRAIETLIGRSEALLVTEAPDLQTLARLRWEETRSLRQYQLFKHLRLFAPAIAEGGAIAVLARRLEADCVAAGEEFCAHVLRWSGCVPGTEWEDYRMAARTMMTRVRRHLARERRAIEQLLALRAAAVQAAAAHISLNRSNAR